MQRNEVIDLNNYRGDDENLTGTEEQASAEELAPGTSLLHGQYKITGFLNSGGFGITYRATDSLDRNVVIKECYPSVMCMRVGNEVRVRSQSYTDEFNNMVANFVKEARALAAMEHRNIVRVHQVFEENQTAYMAIDYIDGLDLLDIIDKEPERLAPRDIEKLTKTTLRAIKYVHDRGMLHRDISPDNILLNADDEPVLIDFGAAREKAQKAGRVMSRLKFVKDGYSPQEFYVEGSEQGPWSDLYSLAASLYHLISGEPPEDGQRRMAALAQKEPDPYTPLQGRFKGFTRGFLAAIDKSLAVVPKNRFQSAEQWLATFPARSSQQVTRVSRPPSRPPYEEEPEINTDRLTQMISGMVASEPAPQAEPAAAVDAPAAEEPASAERVDAPVISPARRPSRPPSKRAETPRDTVRPSRRENPSELAPPLAARSPNSTLEERFVRDSLKGETPQDTASRSNFTLLAAAAASLAVLGTVGMLMFAGGEDNATDVASVAPDTALPIPPANTSEGTISAPTAPPALAPDAVASTPTAEELEEMPEFLRILEERRIQQETGEVPVPSASIPQDEAQPLDERGIGPVSTETEAPTAPVAPKSDIIILEGVQDDTAAVPEATNTDGAITFVDDPDRPVPQSLIAPQADSTAVEPSPSLPEVAPEASPDLPTAAPAQPAPDAATSIGAPNDGEDFGVRVPPANSPKFEVPSITSVTGSRKHPTISSSFIEEKPSVWTLAPAPAR